MKKIIACLLLMLGCDASAQDFVAPCEMEFMREYYRGVDKIIDQAIVLSSDLSITVLPSFFPEYGIRLANNKIYYVQLESSFWAQAKFMERGWEKRATETIKKTRTKVVSASLDPELVNRLTLTYKSAIVRAKKADINGLDGVTYRFFLSDAGCGETWSPEPSTPNGRLVALLELLVSHSKLASINDIQKSEQAIKQLLDNIDSGMN